MRFPKMKYQNQVPLLFPLLGLALNLLKPQFIIKKKTILLSILKYFFYLVIAIFHLLQVRHKLHFLFS